MDGLFIVMDLLFLAHQWKDVNVELVRVRVRGRALLELLHRQGPVQGDQENAL